MFKMLSKCFTATLVSGVIIVVAEMVKETIGEVLEKPNLKIFK